MVIVNNCLYCGKEIALPYSCDCEKSELTFSVHQYVLNEEEKKEVAQTALEKAEALVKYDEALRNNYRLKAIKKEVKRRKQYNDSRIKR